MSTDATEGPVWANDSFPVQKLGEMRKWSRDLEISFSKMQDTLRQLKTDNDRLRESFSEIKSSATFKEQELRHKLSSLQEKWREAREYLQRQAKEHRAQSQELTTLRELSAKAEQEKQFSQNALTQSLQKSNHYINGLHERTAEVQKALVAEKASRHQLEVELARIKTLLSDQEIRALSLNEPDSGQKTEAQQITGMLRERNQQLKNFREHKVQMHAAYEQKLAQFQKTAAEKIQLLESVLQKERGEYTRERAQIEKFRAQLAHLEAAHSALGSESSERIRTLEAQLAESKNRLEVLNGVLGRKVEELQRLQTQARQVQTQTRQKMRVLESQALDEKSRAATLDNILRSQSEEMSQLKARIQQMDLERMTPSRPENEAVKLPPPPNLEQRRRNVSVATFKDGNS